MSEIIATADTPEGVLEIVYDVLVKQGRWGKGHYYDSATDCFCFVGAVGYASGYFRPNRFHTMAREWLYCQTMDAVKTARESAGIGGGTTIVWNDNVTIEDVARLLESMGAA